MDFAVKNVRADKQRTPCVVVPVYEGRRLSEAATALDKISGGAVRRALRREHFQGKPGETLVLHEVSRTSAERIVLAGCGKRRELDEARYRKAAAAAMKAVAATGAASAVVALAELDVADRDAYWKIRQAVEASLDATYRFEAPRARDDTPKVRLKRVTFTLPDRDDVPAGEEGARHGAAIGAGIALTRDLGNLPPNVCTPAYLADRARQLAKEYRSISVKVLGRANMEALGMGSLLSVARGSEEPPQLIVMEYRGDKSKGGGGKSTPVALVGKGITFDSGGISIKPAAQMDEMKYDMCGAASVFGTLKAIARMRLPVNVVGVVAASENLPDGKASKPGDVVTSMSGQTIEILNTDAEGRLVLADALSYTARYEPEVVIDIATLTGACVIALGSPAAGLFANDQDLADALLAAGRYSGDRAWQLPLWEDYQDSLKSNFADMANVGGREAGAVTAACFLSRFARDFRWAHLDIAGIAWRSGSAKGATGRPAGLLSQYLIDRVRAAAADGEEAA